MGSDAGLVLRTDVEALKKKIKNMKGRGEVNIGEVSKMKKSI